MFLLLASAFGITITAFYIYRRFYVQKIFVNEGIPGPEPNWLLGNALAFADETKRHLVVPNWTKKYGKVYGYFEGPTPTLVTSDVDMVQQVFVKNSHIFHGKKLLVFQPPPDSVEDSLNHMLFARGERWKRLRTIVNPTFSAAKLKSLMPLMEKCQLDFMKLIDKKVEDNGRDQAFNIFESFQLLTLDTIAETAFGVELGSLQSKTGSQDPLLRAIQIFFKGLFEVPIAVIASTIVPELMKIFEILEKTKAILLNRGFMSGIMNVEKIMARILKQRKSNPELKRQDLLQMMIELEEHPEALGGHKGLTSQEIVAQAVLFMIAGYETSSNALAYTAFLLANHPEVQDKLMKEINQHFGDGKKTIDYESVQELKYLDCVIYETMRLYPIAQLIINRMAMEDTEINGIRIPKGVTVLADIWTIHRDEHEWGPVDPEQFHPERFLDDYPTKSTRSDIAFLAFGCGPRICIGMRFAMLEIKLTLVNLLRKYRIVKTSRTGDELKVVANFTMTPSNGVWVALNKR